MKVYKKGVFTIFHRGIKCANRDDIGDAYSKNDKAWEGFDFSANDEDLPF